MLRKRSIPTSSNKPGFMSDHPTTMSPSSKSSRLASSFFASPRLFVGFSTKGLSENEAVMSPTSTLETKPFASIKNPFFAEKNAKKPVLAIKQHSHVWDCGDSGPIGLGLVDALMEEGVKESGSKKERRMVLFGSQLKIQIPPIVHRPVSPTGSVESPRSPVEFGIKTMNLHVGPFSPSYIARDGITSPGLFTGSLSATEMELSEDYTRVITHGPNPKTTHIFDNCIVESCGDSPVCPSDVFLRFCYKCGKNLGQGKDIFMYRGEKAFCSRECRFKEISSENASEKHLSEVVL